MSLAVLQQSEKLDKELRSPLIDWQLAQLEQLLQRYQTLFVVPKGLPPTRDLDHRIPLKDSTLAIKSKPYRYLHLQKEEIDRHVSELLQQGVIQFSSGPYCSLVLLVMKQNGR